GPPPARCRLSAEGAEGARGRAGGDRRGRAGQGAGCHAATSTGKPTAVSRDAAGVTGDRPVNNRGGGTRMRPVRIAIAFAAFAALGLPAAQAQMKLKWAHVYETPEPYHTEALWAAEEIKKRTGGK